MKNSSIPLPKLKKMDFEFSFKVHFLLQYFLLRE